MKLNLSQIRDITTGAVFISEDKNGFHFYRFTGEQRQLYKNRSDDFYMKSFASSGVKFRFLTNSQTLFLRAEVAAGSSRRYFSFEIFVNGEKIDSLDNFSDMQLPPAYAKLDFPLGEFSKKINLGDGEKDICIYFPWSVSVTLKEFALDDNSLITPQKFKKKMLCFGDSITQGYDALSPSNKYITKLANIFNAEEYNKAIGGEIFFPELAATRESFEPDYITVSYGTNDWNRCTQEEFYKNCSAFFSNLTANYPNVKTFVITPIWRKEITEYRKFGDFKEVDRIIKSVTGKYENITVISGFDFVKHSEEFYADLRLHPNDEGFKQYFKSLKSKIAK